MFFIFANGRGVESNLVDRQNFINHREHLVQFLVPVMCHASGEDEFWLGKSAFRKVFGYRVRKRSCAMLRSLSNGTGVDDHFVCQGPIVGFVIAPCGIVSGDSLRVGFVGLAPKGVNVITWHSSILSLFQAKGTDLKHKKGGFPRPLLNIVKNSYQMYFFNGLPTRKLMTLWALIT